MILFCGSVTPTLDYLREFHEVTVTEDPVTETDAEFIVAHGYRHLVPAGVLAAVPAINIHPSYLPFNRGAHPYLWSHVENAPSGVTVHLMDAHLDTGPVYAQRLIPANPRHTIWEHRARLQHEATALFKEVWPKIRRGELAPRPQQGEGSYHREADRDSLYLPHGFDTPVGELLGERIAA